MYPNIFLWSFMLCQALGSPAGVDELLNCGPSKYSASQYVCYDGSFLCPKVNGVPTLRCGPDCYLPSLYSCSNGVLQQLPSSVTKSVPSATSVAPSCSNTPVTLELRDPPYENFFYSDCNIAAQVVVTSPLSDSNLTIIGPRLLVAWPAGNSGVAAFFAPQNGVNGSLGIELKNSTSERSLDPVYEVANSSTTNKNATVGVSGIISFNSSASLTVPILGSIRTIRDFTEGPSLLVENIQKAIQYTEDGSTVTLSRLWLDNSTTVSLKFSPDGSQGTSIKIDRSTPNTTLQFDGGTYKFSASFNYPQLKQLSPKEIFKPSAQSLITQQSDSSQSLSFLSYSDKLLAGAWRFLTYFGRDSMISLLLLNSVLQEGKSGPIEAGIGAVLERINRTDGSVAHEETIGDYATYLSEQKNMTSTAPQYDYKMIDSDLFLPVVAKQYFVDSDVGRSRSASFLARQASVNPSNFNLSYADLLHIGASRIMTMAAPFAANNNQTKENLFHLKTGQTVGQWRDSEYGIGGGRIPYDVNTALVPAALRAIGALANAGLFPTESSWNTTADTYAQVWEDYSLAFFEVQVPLSEAKSRLATYKTASNFSGPDGGDSLSGDVFYYAVALDGNNEQSVVEVLNSDDCFRHFLLNTTNQTQLTRFVSQTADHLLNTFPAGLYTSVGILVANPAYGNSPVYATNFTTAAYHGTVVWSWNSLAMMAKGLENQLSRCKSDSKPDFCTDVTILGKIQKAYTKLWDVIDANKDHLSSEVWSWVYPSEQEGFVFTPLGALPPPPGVNPTESDIRQLWSLTFLAVTRKSDLEM